MTPPNNRQPTNKRKRLLRWLLEGLGLLLLLTLIHLWQTRDAMVGSAPPLEGRLLDGQGFSLEGRPPRPLLVYFWASWCPVCGLTSGNIASLAEDHDVVTIAMQSGGPDEVAAYLSEKALAFPVLIDAAGEIARTWQVRGVPTVYILDSDNRIRHVTVGYSSTLGLLARLWLANR